MTEGVHAGECVSLLSVRCTGLHKHQLDHIMYMHRLPSPESSAGAVTQMAAQLQGVRKPLEFVHLLGKTCKDAQNDLVQQLGIWLPETPQEACIETWALWYLNTRTHVIKGESYEWS